MHKVINLNNPDTLKKAIEEIGKYRLGLADKCERFCSELADTGIIKANENAIWLNDLGNIKSAVFFYKKMHPVKDGCEGLLIGSDAYLITKSWFNLDGYQSAEVSALLMAEFGSGKMAQTTTMSVLAKPVHAGRGTFPNQTHAGQTHWCYFDGHKWHNNNGIKPTMPIYKAYMEMDKQLKEIGRRVFKS